MNSRNLSYLEHVVRSKKESLLFASYPSSGWNWTVDVLSYALGLELLGEFKIEYKEALSLRQAEVKPFQLVYPADARVSFGVPLKEQVPGVPIDYCYHVHGYWGESPLWRLNQAKTIFVVRDLPTTLFSQYAKRREKYKNFESFLDSENGLEKIIHYYNSWSDLCSKRSFESFHITKYEDMRESPLPTFKALGVFCFGFDIKDAHWEEALDYYSFTNQKAREKIYNKDDKKHFHYKGKSNYREEMSEDSYSKIVQTLKKHLKSSFGYNY